MDSAQFFNNDSDAMIGHPLLVGALFHSHQIANLQLHFKKA